MSKPRLPLSVLAALGLSTAGVGCNPIEVLGPCLSMVPMPHPDDDSDTSAKVNQEKNETPHVGPCLSPMPEPRMGPCLSPMREPAVRPVPIPRMEPEPEMTVCLSIAPLAPSPQPDPPSTGDKSAPHTVDNAKQAVLKRGILPADVAARLLRDNKD